MFDDKRSKKILLIAHCILNQNAKIDRCAHYPGVIKEVTSTLIESGVGIVQMPCPELLHLGLDRQVERGAPTTIEWEDTRVGQRMAEDRGRNQCREIANDLVYQVEEYRKNGFEIVGLVGINGSPTCDIETTWAKDQEKQGCGVFIINCSKKNSAGEVFVFRRKVSKPMNRREPLLRSKSYARAANPHKLHRSQAATRFPAGRASQAMKR